MTYIAPEMNPNDMPDESVKPTPFQGLAVLTTSDQAAVEAFIARATLAHEFPMQGGRATGMDELDAELALLPGSLTSIIAREGVGKSSIALQWARWMSGGGRVVYVLTEMTRWDVTARLVAQVAHMSVRDVKTPRTPEQLAMGKPVASFALPSWTCTATSHSGMPPERRRTTGTPTRWTNTRRSSSSSC